jgi:hypothetical protein
MQLKGLSLINTQVTDAGVKRLEKALPNCYIGSGYRDGLSTPDY